MRECAFMLLILLVPLIPALVLFKFLPSSADVEGPLKGLKIKLGGAFGGYIVGVLVSWQVANSLLAPTWSDNWIVEAQVKFEGAPLDGARVSDSLVLVRPPNPYIDSDGKVQLMVPIPRVRSGTNSQPTLIVSYEGYETANVPLDPDGKHLQSYGGKNYQVTFVPKTHEIIVGQPILLTRQTH